MPVESEPREFHDRAVVASLKQGQSRTRQRAGGKFHDRAVVASLKLHVRRERDEVQGQFHDRAVVASLKQQRNQLVHEAVPEFHDRAVVASLKLISCDSSRTSLRNSTRSEERRVGKEGRS